MAASEADMDTLLQFIAQGGQFTVDRKGNIVAPGAGAGAATALATGTAGVSADDLRAQRASITAQREADRQADRQTRAQREADRDAQAQADRQARQARSQQQADERRRASQERNAKRAHAPLDAVTSWVEGLPTPGGNLALLLILLFFAFAIIPVNGGATRLELIYLVLTGGADLPTNAAGTSGNTQASTPGASDIATGIRAGVGAAIGSVLGGGTVLPGIGGGPGLPGLNAGFAPFVPSADLAPSR